MILSGSLFFTACKKEFSDNFNAYAGHPLNDTAWVRNQPNSASLFDLIEDVLPERFLLDSFEINQADTVRFGDSVQVILPAGSCTNPGGGPSNSTQAFIQIFPLRTKGDFIRFMRPTTSKDGYLLETGGALFVRVTGIDGKELTLSPNTNATILFNDITTPKNNMQLFYGVESAPLPSVPIDTSFSWIRGTDTSYLATWYTPGANPPQTAFAGYQIHPLSLRWLAAERYTDSTLPSTKVTAILSPNFTNKNTLVFAVFANQRTVVNLHGDYPSRSFFAEKIPIGAAVKLISVSKIGSDIYLGTNDISSVQHITSYTLNPVKISLSGLNSFLSNL